MPTIRSILLAAVAVSCLPGATRAGEAAASGRPNVVFLLADDLGWRDTSLYGSTFYETPNIDALAERGMRFANAYSANPLCSPTRASILTGQYPGRLRFTTPAGHLKQEVLDPIVPDQGPPQSKWVVPQTRTRLPLDYYTLSEALHDAGYATAHFGKWHLGWPPYQPENQGFDFNLPGGSFPGPPGGYFAPFKVDTLRDCPDGTHVDDRLTRDAIDFVRKHKDRPFLLNYWLFSVHAPYQAKEELIARYRARVDPNAPQRSPTMGGMIHTGDACVGQLVQAIDSLGLAERTIVIFTADNGGNMYDRVDDTTPTSNLPLRGGKATIYEGGSRVPLVVIWPGHVEPGSTSDAVVSSIDYYPTILEMLGLDAKPGVAFDGVSIVPALKGGTLAREAVFCHFPHPGVEPARFPATSVRKGDWKLIHVWCDGPDQTDRYELYNLADDLGETNNLADAMPDKVKELDALIRRHLDETQALVPKPNPAYDPTRGPVAGWHPSSFCKLSARDGRLVVESTGGDPNLSTGNVPAVSGELVMKLRVRSTSRGAAHFYWATQKGPRFRREVRLDLPIEHDGQWHEHAIEFTADSTLRAVRIDPSSAPGRIEFDRISLCRPDGTLLKEWEFDAEAR